MIDVEETLQELRDLGIYRRLQMVSGPQGARILVDGKPAILLCSNNSLGLAGHSRVRQAAADAAIRWGAGSGSSRLGAGNMTLHRRLEDRLAAFVGMPKAVAIGSGYLANMSVTSALTSGGDIVLSDERNHPSIVDGCHISGAEVWEYRHRDVDHIEHLFAESRGRVTVIATETLFAGEGDLAPLEDIVALAQDHGARVVIDESHAIGALGPAGRGLAAELDLTDAIDVVVSSLGQALGSYGAFAACEPALAKYLVNRAPALSQSTSLPPAAVAGALAALEILEAEPRRVQRLKLNADLVRNGLDRAGFDTGSSVAHVVPIAIGDEALTVKFADAALKQGVFVQPLLPPVVPFGQSRVLVAPTSSHTSIELDGAIRRLRTVAHHIALPLSPRSKPTNPAEHFGVLQAA